ncbi:ABC transporter ATP-binding protein [Candidatus Saccharibacteria bacterium]|nr:ABC transporter ATP-binding protein [Candidatus Saccharibacteria bacterium]
MFHLLKYLTPKDRFLTLLCIALVAVQVFFDLQLPSYTQEITVLVSSENNDINQYLVAGGKMLGCTLGSIAVSIVVGFFAAKIAANLSFGIRDRVFKKITKFSQREINKFSTASLITRTTNDITQVQMFVASALQVFVRAPIMAAWAIQKILASSLTLSMLVAAAVIILLTVIIVLMLVMIPKFRKIQRQIDDVNRIARENLTGLKVIRAFNAETYEEKKFSRKNTALMCTQLFTMRGLAVLFPVMILIESTLSLMIYWVGAKIVNDLSVAERAELFGNVVAFNSYAIYVVMSFVMMMVLLIIFPRAQVSAKRIREVLNEDITIKEGNGIGAESETKTKGELEFKNVSFKYNDDETYCIKNVSFKIDQGKTLAFVGATGAGKSTIANLITRLSEPDSGEILLDGIPLKDYKFEELYQKITVVPQKSTLFAGTVRSNIAFGKAKTTFSDEEINKALKIAEAKSFVDKLGGLNAKVTQSGANLSGGQKQRLQIARAVIRKPEILVFDDSFSALDYKTDRKLRDNLSRELKDTTRIIVAQRISTIKKADQIIVLDHGQVAGVGTHDELMKKSSLYHEIVLTQLSQAELD